MLSTSNSISQMEDIHIMNHAKKLAAALLALCLMTVCALGALAEEQLNDLLGFYERATGQEAGVAEAPVAEAAEAPAAQEEPPARKGGYVTYAPVTGSESEE